MQFQSKIKTNNYTFLFGHRTDIDIKKSRYANLMYARYRLLLVIICLEILDNVIIVRTYIVIIIIIIIVKVCNCRHLGGLILCKTLNSSPPEIESNNGARNICTGTNGLYCLD